MSKIGVDTGGTFTDFVFYDGNEIKIHKVLSTPHDPSQAILTGINDLSEDIPKIFILIHGTTVATNALLERKGAKVVLVTTEGFEDVFEIGRQNRKKLYDLFIERKKLLVESNHRFGLKERTSYEGEILVDLIESDVEKLAEKIDLLDVEAIAISFLHSYENPKNELLAEKKLMGLGLPITRSSKLIPEFREYERTSTTIANSYLIPKVKSYMDSLNNRFEGSKIYVMQSNGGVISPEQAGNEPVRIITSGPAGGVVGAFRIAQTAGKEKVLTYDMGGTSTDISLCDGSLQFTTESIIDEIPIKVPMIDVSTIGAGGGSIAYIDSGGVINVGPESSGADPGPACYGKGVKPTVTDANLVLGRIDPDLFLGGKMKIFPDRSEDAINSLGVNGSMNVKELAEIIIKIANSNMERALRVISIGRGYDPRDFTLVSFGGAGGLHASELAKELGIKTVLFPYNPGVLSAYGMLMADSFKDYSQSYFANSKTAKISDLEKAYRVLEKQAVKDFESEDISFERYIDLRYKRQAHEITVRFSKNYENTFHEVHESMYSYYKEEDEIEIVVLRLRAIAEYSNIKISKFDKDSKEVSYKQKEIYFDGSEQPAKIYIRNDFFPGFKFSGNSIILEDTSTIFIPKMFNSEVDQWGNIISTLS